MPFTKIRPEEREIFVLFAIVMGFSAFTAEIGYVVGTSGFLADLGIQQIPLLWLIDMAGIIFSTTLIFMKIDHWDRRKFLVGLLWGAALLYLAAWGGLVSETLNWLTYPLIYWLAEQQVLVIPIIFWAFANDLFLPQQSKRIFPLLAASGIVGGVLGNTLAVLWASRFELAAGTGLLILLNAVVLGLLGGYLFFRDAQKVTARRGADPKRIQDIFTDGFDFIKNVEIFRYLAIAMLGVGFVFTLVEFNFLAVVYDSFQGAAFQRFFGIFRIFQSLGILALQTLLAHRVLQKMELKRVFFVLPVASLGLLAAALLFPGLIMMVLTRLVGRSILLGLDEPARKALQGLIPDEKRGRVSSFLDGYLLPVGTVVGSLLLLVCLLGVNAGWLSSVGLLNLTLVIGLVAVGVVLWALAQFLHSYDTSLLNWRLARRKRRSNLIKLDF